MSAFTPTRFEIEVAAPFRLDFTVWTLRRRSQNMVDQWDGSRYLRTFVIGGVTVAVAVHQESEDPRARLVVEVRHTGAGLNEHLITEIRQTLSGTLGLEVDIGDFYRLAEGEPRLAILAHQFVGMRPPRFPSVFEAVVNAIACQQLSLTVGIHLLNRISVQFGSDGPEGSGAAHAFPTPERLARADPGDLRALGFSRSKAVAITDLAQRIAAGVTDLESLKDVDDDRAMATLLDLTGIGRWSAEYVLLRGLGRLHVLPGDDVGARNNLRKRFGLAPSAGYAEVHQLADRWSPYGGLVYFHLLLDALAVSGNVSPRASDVSIGTSQSPGRR